MADLCKHYIVASTEPPYAAEWCAEVATDPDTPGRYRVLRLRYGGATHGPLNDLPWEYACQLADSWASQEPAQPDPALRTYLDHISSIPATVREVRRAGDPDAIWDAVRATWVESDTALQRRILGDT
jgi:hypothetical protein